MVRSFLSEHSVEYCLVNRLYNSLSSKWEISPLFFWRSREGSRIAEECDNGERIRVAAVYARRPKLVSPGHNVLVMKVNDRIFSRANYLTGQGIPVFCAVPRVSQILDFQVNSVCSWFILAQDSPIIDVQIRLDINSGLIQNRSDENEKKVIPIVEQQISDIIKEQTKAISLSDAIAIISCRNGEVLGRYPSFFWFGGYKPFYLFLKERRV